MHSAARVYSHEFLFTIYYRASRKHRAYAKRAKKLSIAKTVKTTINRSPLATISLKLFIELGKIRFRCCNNSMKILDIDFLTLGATKMLKMIIFVWCFIDVKETWMILLKIREWKLDCVTKIFCFFYFGVSGVNFTL